MGSTAPRIHESYWAIVPFIAEVCHFPTEALYIILMSSCVGGSKVLLRTISYALRVLYQLPKCYINFLWQKNWLLRRRQRLGLGWRLGPAQLVPYPQVLRVPLSHSDSSQLPGLAVFFRKMAAIWKRVTTMRSQTGGKLEILCILPWQQVHDDINYLCHVWCSVGFGNKSLGPWALRALGTRDLLRQRTSQTWHN